MLKKIFIGFVILSFLMVSMGCAEWSRTTKGAAIGAGAGGAAGALIGYATGSTVAGLLIGAAVGGVAGGFIGNYMDNRRLRSHGTSRALKLSVSAKALKSPSALGSCLMSIKRTLKMAPKANWRSYPPF